METERKHSHSDTEGTQLQVDKVAEWKEVNGSSCAPPSPNMCSFGRSLACPRSSVSMNGSQQNDLFPCRLEDCCFTAAGCQGLTSVLAASQTLKKLNLENTKVGDAGVKLLCEGLKHPGCRLLTLA